MLNWLDVAILVVLAYFIYIGFRHGFLVGLVELTGIAVSIGIPFLLYVPGSRLLGRLGVSEVYAAALAFLIIWFVTLNLYFFLARRFYRGIPRGVRRSRANKVLGVFPGLVRGLILVAIILALVVSLPNPWVTPRALERSVLAPPLLNVTTDVALYAADIFGGAIRTALGFVTIEPNAEGRVGLPFSVQNPTIDSQAEDAMLRLVNRERRERGLRTLVMDSTIREVARRHSIDMFRRGYFAHVSLGGSSPFQRISRGGVRFTVAGENLALAPTVEVAHRGLMNSPGHRANVLNPGFRRVGIGVIRGGRYGMMFTQDFAN